jgi:hypothetical protein
VGTVSAGALQRNHENNENDENGAVKRAAGLLGHGRVDASGPAAVRNLLFAKNVNFPLITPLFVSLHVLLFSRFRKYFLFRLSFFLAFALSPGAAPTEMSHCLFRDEARDVSY